MKNLSLIFILCLAAFSTGMNAVKAQAGAPYFIRAGTTDDPTTMKTITWMTDQAANPQAVMKIAKQADGEGSFVQKTGKTMQYTYNSSMSGGGGADVPRTAYSVTVDGLEPGTAYIYQVGDGTDWSKTLTFETTTATNEFSFYVLGDMQFYTDNQITDVAGGTAWMRKVAGRYENAATKPLFSIQIGDIVDREHVWNYYRLFGEVCDDYPGFGSADMICAMGNHEYYYGTNGHQPADNPYRGEISKFLNGTPPTNAPPAAGSGTFFVDYGSMRVFTLDFAYRDQHPVDNELLAYPETPTYTSAQVIDAQLAWLREHLANCDKRWKVVSMHYPLYQGPPLPTDWPMFPESAQLAFGALFEEFGVQFVFAGHTHVDRRIQVKGGVTLQSGHNANVTPNAPTYITCGNMGEFTSSTTYYRVDVDDEKMVFSNVRNDNGGNVGYSLTVRNWAKSVTIAGEGGKTEITEPDGTLQMEATVLPEYASNRSVTWSIMTNPPANVATISSGGLITARRNGTVTVTATTRDGSALSATTTITINGYPIPVTSVTVSGEGGATGITEPGGALQMKADVQPDNATDKTVVWSITPETGTANISNSGWLTAVNNGTVTVRATANDGSDRYGEATIDISGQHVTGVESLFAPNLKIYPNPFTDACHIDGAEGCTLRVMDAAGATVHLQKITGAKETVRLEQLPPGVFFFVVEKDGQTKTEKAVKE